MDKSLFHKLGIGQLDKMPESNKRHVIFANGECNNYNALKTIVTSDAYLIGVDGGTNHIFRAGLTPNIVVGDMDSIEPQFWASLKEQEIPTILHPVDKDQSDLELAIELSLSLNPSEIVFAAATGGRIDHFLVNLMLILREDLKGIPVEFADGQSRIVLLRSHGDTSLASAQAGPDQSVLDQSVLDQSDLKLRNRKFRGVEGQLFSLLPLTSDVEIEQLAGAKWNLSHEPLPLGSSRGVSNVFMGEFIELSLKQGVLLVIFPEI